MPRIYTKTGDKGLTGLVGGGRVSKSDARVEALGGVDEANACIGVSRLDASDMQDIDSLLSRVQNELFNLGALLATPSGKAKPGAPGISPGQIERLETEIDRFEASLEPLRNFVLPAGSPLAAHIHLARTVCRRAERAVVALAGETEVPKEAVIYLNRLSDLLFVLARTANARSGVRELKWNPEGNE